MISEAIDRYLRRTGAAEFSPRAALIDMDGTLLDTMSRHTLAWHRMMTELGVKCRRDEFYLYEGMTGPATIASSAGTPQRRKPLNFMPARPVISVNFPARRPWPERSG